MNDNQILDRGVLVALRFASADLSPYRDSTGSLPPGWLNWQGPIDEVADYEAAVEQGFLSSWGTKLLPLGRQALREQGFPEQTTFKEFWDWFYRETLP